MKTVMTPELLEELGWVKKDEAGFCCYSYPNKDAYNVIIAESDIKDYTLNRVVSLMIRDVREREERTISIIFEEGEI